MSRPVEVGQPVLVCYELATITGGVVTKTYAFPSQWTAEVAYQHPKHKIAIEEYLPHFEDTTGDPPYFVHVTERHLIEQAVEGQAWADDIADQLDRILGPKEPRQ